MVGQKLYPQPLFLVGYCISGIGDTAFDFDYNTGEYVIGDYISYANKFKVNKNYNINAVVIYKYFSDTEGESISYGCTLSTLHITEIEQSGSFIYVTIPSSAISAYADFGDNVNAWYRLDSLTLAGQSKQLNSYTNGATINNIPDGKDHQIEFRLTHK